MEFKQEPNKIEKTRNQRIQQDSFLSNLSVIFSVYSNMSMMQHLDGIKAILSKVNKESKFEIGKNTDEKLLKATEKYLQELELDPPPLWNTGSDYLEDGDLIEFYERNSKRGK